MMKKRILMVVMDGLGDRGCRSLGGLTPLQVAETPNLDWFAQNGSSGIMDLISPGVRPGSDTSHLSLLGYEPYSVYKGRGPFEAAGIGLVGRKGDVAFRCNFSTVDEAMNVVDRRAGRVKEPDTVELVNALQGMTIQGIEVHVRQGTEHRAALLLRGPGLSADVSDADPHEMGPVLESRPLSPGADLTARVVNEFVRRSYEIWKDHPVNQRRRQEGLPEANILLPRGAGSFPDIDPFPQKHGMKAACVAGVGMIKGICGICGLDVLDVPEACTGGLDTDMIAKAEAALSALKEYDFVLMNIKAPDLTGHDGHAEEKLKVVRRLDTMAAYIRERLEDDMVVAFTADHCTPVDAGDHTGDPVPLTIYTQGLVQDRCQSFNEADCAYGRLGRLRGCDLLPVLMDMANRSTKFGA
ncbi:MAG: 2,3-bisphosphoglycerate-independent phosphoglycerate mutase [Candidatus Methanomethylophilaceae archaeon]|nr:2,3-bisphosphoglycerate-independent phosphoglycerate mutase [Candidatus Methanomethylophilaceae archaeon]